MDISRESDPKSLYKIPVLSSYGRNLECYVWERYLEKISVVGVYRAAIDNSEFRMFASCSSHGLAFLFSFGDKLLHK